MYGGKRGSPSLSGAVIDGLYLSKILCMYVLTVKQMGEGRGFAASTFSVNLETYYQLISSHFWFKGKKQVEEK